MRQHLPLIALLLLAFTLRVASLTAVPPGLTHDEANHGREAIELLDGNLRFYFPLNYGSEPFYSYSVAGTMALVGENLFALRLAGVFFGLLMLAALYRWARQLFGQEVALLAVGLTAVGYWPIVASRMALRATLLPFFLLGAVYFFWQLLYRPTPRRRDVAFLGAFIALTLHIYLASRVLWLIFPAFLVALFFLERDTFWRSWRRVLLSLGVAGLLVLPMFIYLEFVPTAETRLEMLDSTLNQARNGNIQPLLQNSAEALLALVWPGYGDQFLAYNIPGRPVFSWLVAPFFLLGVAASLWRWRDPRYAFLLGWLLVGLAPSLITGATANTTRNIGALPVLYLLAGLGFWQVGQWVGAGWGLGKKAGVGLAILWLGVIGLLNSHAYFTVWANMPDVRAAYQTTIIAALGYSDEAFPPEQPVLLSSVYPGSAHDTSISMVMLREKERPLRWSDARLGMIWPGGEMDLPLLVPASTPLHPYLGQWATPQGQFDQHPDDLDPFFTHYTFAPPVPENELGANFNGGIELLTAVWLSETTSPGGVAELVTTWRVLDPERVGERVPPADATETVLFTHLLRPDGSILAQADVLSAPSWGWQAGDVVVQVHQMWVAPDTAVGEYTAVVGIYEERSGRRLPLVEGGDTVTVAPLVVGGGE